MKEVTVTKQSHGQRIDKFVRKYLSDAPLNFIYKLFRVKDVKVNDKRVKSDYVLSEGDIVKIYVTDQQLEDFTKKDSLTKLNVKLDIVYEDNNILIINKPSGLLVHGDENEKRITLNNFVLNYLMSKGEYSDSDVFTPSPCHRLDRNTSGIIIYAKNFESLDLLERLFKDKTEVEKTYLALVCGSLTKDGEINVPLYKDEKKKMVYVRSLEHGGKSALTYYHVEKNYHDYTLLSVKIVTGRTHQIRVHFAYIHHPLIGDQKYGDFAMNKVFDKRFNYQSQFLHAKTIKFLNIPAPLDYLSGKIFNASLPEKECAILKALE